MAVSTSTKPTRYTPEQREAVLKAVESGKTAKVVSEELKIPVHTIYGWTATRGKMKALKKTTPSSAPVLAIGGGLLRQPPANVNGSKQMKKQDPKPTVYEIPDPPAARVPATPHEDVRRTEYVVKLEKRVKFLESLVEVYKAAAEDALR